MQMKNLGVLGVLEQLGGLAFMKICVQKPLQLFHMHSGRSAWCDEEFHFQDSKQYEHRPFVIDVLEPSVLVQFPSCI